MVDCPLSGEFDATDRRFPSELIASAIVKKRFRDCLPTTSNERKPRILVVDDEPSITQVVEMFLTEDDAFTVITENHAVLALDRIKNCEPDLLILDLNMPGMTGMEIARGARDIPTFGQRPILFFGGRPPKNLETITNASTEYLMKGRPIQDLVATVNRMLRRIQ